MKMLRTEKGAALLVVLVLSVVAMVVVAGLMYMIIEGTKSSGGGKRYKTALEACKAGVGIATQVIDARANPGIPLSNFTIPDSNRLFAAANGKLTQTTQNWAVGYSSSTIIDPADTTTYDFHYDLGAAPVFRTYVKITYTTQGNTSDGSALHKHGVVANAGEIVASAVPFNYSIEMLCQDISQPRERAKLSVLYQF